MLFKKENRLNYEETVETMMEMMKIQFKPIEGMDIYFSPSKQTFYGVAPFEAGIFRIEIFTVFVDKIRQVQVKLQEIVEMPKDKLFITIEDVQNLYEENMKKERETNHLTQDDLLDLYNFATALGDTEYQNEIKGKLAAHSV